MPTSIYVHVPFCDARCDYCGFYSGEPRELADRFKRALPIELADWLGETELSPGCETLYFGGGTPALLGEGRLAAIIEGVDDLLPLEPGCEVTVEANPCSTKNPAPLARAGATRLSVGVQSLDRGTLAQLGRRHTPEEALALVSCAAKGDFDSVSADLIIGLPTLTPNLIKEAVTQLAAAGARHLSAYSLELLEGTALYARNESGRWSVVSEEEEERQWDALVEAATAQRFEMYEVSNFAHPGHRSRHNLSYWSGAPYIGLGPGAHAYLPGRSRWGDRLWNEPGLEKYLAAVESGGVVPRTGETLTRNEALLETLFLGLRVAEPIALTPLADRFGLDPDGVAKNFCVLEERGVVTLTHDKGLCARPTRKGMRLADGAAADLAARLAGEAL